MDPGLSACCCVWKLYLELWAEKAGSLLHPRPRLYVLHRSVVHLVSHRPACFSLSTFLTLILALNVSSSPVSPPAIFPHDPATLSTESLMRVLRRWNPARRDKIRASRDTSATPIALRTAGRRGDAGNFNFVTLKVCWKWNGNGIQLNIMKIQIQNMFDVTKTGSAGWMEEQRWCYINPKNSEGVLFLPSELKSHWQRASVAPSAPEAPRKQKEVFPLDASLNKKWAACVLASGDVMQVVCSEVLLRFSIIRSHFSFFLHHNVHKSTQTLSKEFYGMQ